MSSSVSISIATNTAIAAAKGFGWMVTASPTLFAETIHSLADIANQVLLKVGEVRGRGGPDSTHPLGRGQERFFWALVSAVSVFFIGCGINIYHGIDALLNRHPVEPFTPLVLGLLLFALVLESFTFVVALRELGGWQGLARNRTNTTVLAVLLEDAVALVGILLTLLVAGISYVSGPRPAFDAAVAITVGVMLGVMALFLAALNRKLLIDTSDREIDAVVTRFLDGKNVRADVSSIVVDSGHAVVLVRLRDDLAAVPAASDLRTFGDELKRSEIADGAKLIDEVYWRTR
jgi:solute carrier family 30 (zinc transporter), member 9